MHNYVSKYSEYKIEVLAILAYVVTLLAIDYENCECAVDSMFFKPIKHM